MVLSRTRAKKVSRKDRIFWLRFSWCLLIAGANVSSLKRFDTAMSLVFVRPTR
jgi:hypothetical protein